MRDQINEVAELLRNSANVSNKTRNELERALGYLANASMRSGESRRQYLALARIISSTV